MSLKEAQTAECAQEFLREVIQRFPCQIHTVLPENGEGVIDRYCRSREWVSGRHLFDRACQSYGIEYRLTRRYKLRANGLVERFNG